MAEGNNTKIIDACIDDFIKSNGIAQNAVDAFELFVGIQATKQQDLTAEDIYAAIVDGANDGGIDIFLPLLDDQPVLTQEDVAESAPVKGSNLTLIVCQSKNAVNFAEATLDKWLATMPIILDLNISNEILAARFNPALTEKIIAFRDALVAVSVKRADVNIRYIYATRSNDFTGWSTFDSKILQLENLTKKAIQCKSVTIECLSSSELFQLYRSEAPETRTLAFVGNPMSMQYRDGIGYVGLVQLHGLKNFVKNESNLIDERIFESNVRHFQGSVDVNSKIKNTIQNDRERDFWWLNNGVTIVATSASTLGNYLHLENPQIVNGLQTTYSLFESLCTEKEDGRCVLVKVIVSTDKATVDRVISATNSQTAVNPASLRATDEVQRKIEAYFETKGYFYDRRKNYYRNRGKPISKIFSIGFVAQAIHTILNFSPASARARPSSLIKDETTYHSIFNAGRDYHSYLNAVLMCQQSRNYISTICVDDRNIMANYAFHLALIGTAFSLGKSHFTDKDVASLALMKFSAALPEAHIWLIDYIREHLRANPNANVITLSKSNQFTENIITSLRTKIHA